MSRPGEVDLSATRDVDAEGKFHCYRVDAGEVVVQDADGEVEFEREGRYPTEQLTGLPTWT